MRKFRQAHIIPSLGTWAQNILPPGKGQAMGIHRKSHGQHPREEKQEKKGTKFTQNSHKLHSQGMGGLPLNASPGGQCRLHGATVCDTDNF